MNIHQSLKISTNKLKLQNIPSADLDAEVLLLEALNRSRYKKLDKSWLYINDNYELNKNEEKLFNSFINQRLKNKPVAYIINRKEFYGYDFYVDENVLIPRPETEFIVEEVLKIINNINGDGHLKECPSPMSDKIDLIDIGTGSGCIIISVLNELAERKKENVIQNAYANDISKKAIEIAKINAKEYNLDKKIKFVANDFEKFIKKEFSSTANQFIITANLPYINNDKYKKLLPNVRKYEPKTALAGRGKNGLDLIEKLISLIPNIKSKFNSHNYILLEADPSQIKKIKILLKRKLNILNIKTIKDLRGKNRIILAKTSQTKRLSTI
jgi:release factor glutamine methyltransferase